MAQISPAGRRRIMQAVKSRDTLLEMQFRRALRETGLRGYRTHVSNLPGRPDVCFTRWKTCIFVDGCFWHSCPACGLTPSSNTGYWEPKLLRNKQRDSQVTSELETRGYTVLRLWEHDLRSDMGECIRMVEAALATRGRPPARRAK